MKGGVSGGKFDPVVGNSVYPWIGGGREHIVYQGSVAFKTDFIFIAGSRNVAVGRGHCWHSQKSARYKGGCIEGAVGLMWVVTVNTFDMFTDGTRVVLCWVMNAGVGKHRMPVGLVQISQDVFCCHCAAVTDQTGGLFHTVVQQPLWMAGTMGPMTAATGVIGNGGVA